MKRRIVRREKMEIAILLNRLNGRGVLILLVAITRVAAGALFSFFFHFAQGGVLD